MAKRNAAAQQQREQEEWRLAQDWVRWLRAGKDPATVMLHGIVLEQGEVAYLSSPLHYSRLYGGSGQYSTSGGFAFGRPGFVLGMMAANAAVNACRRNAARRDMQPLWRELEELPTIVTNYRMMCHKPGRGWLSFYYNAVQEFYPDPANWTVDFGFAEVEPLRLGGLAAPTVAVLTGWCILGADRWQENPGLMPLVESARATEVEQQAKLEIEGGAKLPRIPGQG